MEKEKHITLFLVDDNVLYLKNLEYSFSSRDYYKVQTFKTGEHCLEELTTTKPDIIILDYYLNSINKEAKNGLEILHKMREIYPKLPVLILTNEDNPEIKRDCIENNATDFIIKNEMSVAQLREIITSTFLDRKINENDAIVHLHQAIKNSNREKA